MSELTEDSGGAKLDQSAHWALEALSQDLGQAVTERQWALIQAENLSNKSLDDVARIKALWSAHFPAGKASEITVDDIDDRRFPCLGLTVEGWVPLTGKNEQGVWTRAQESGPTHRPIESLSGPVLSLTCGPARNVATTFDASEAFKVAFRAHKGLLREALIASILAGLFGIASALYTMQVYDRVVPTGALPTLLVLTVGVLITVVLEFVAKQIKTSFVDRASDSIDRSLGQMFLSVD